MRDGGYIEEQMRWTYSAGQTAKTRAGSCPAPFIGLFADVKAVP